jgi:signal transduction histidine kinase
MTPRSRFLLSYFAAWVPVAALYSLMIFLYSGDRSVQGAIFGGTQSTFVAAVLGLVVWSVTRRRAERPRPLLAAVRMHALSAIAYTVVWTGLNVASIALFAPKYVLPSFLRYAVGWELMTGVFIYGLVAGIAHAITVSARLRREREAVNRAEMLRARAELSAVRAQMNPHFLFNTLHSIAALVRTDPAAVEDALERLAHLLRRLLDTNRSGADRIALAEEWAIVRDQLELEKLRFGDRMHVDADLEPDALDCAVPVFTLQPLVENAVRHGVAAQTRRCTITIVARVRGDVLELIVRDDGPGAEAKAALNAPGLGLRAVRQRLIADHGDRMGFHVDSAPGRGFSVSVTIPASAVPSVAIPAAAL